MQQDNPTQHVLWLDDDLLALNKPAGLLSLPDGYDPTKPHVRSLFEPYYGRLWIVHRLDRLTSGVLLMARNPEIHRSINDQFAQRKVNKTYHALVIGKPDWDTRQVELPLRTNVGRRHRTIPDTQQGKPAFTALRVLDRFAGFTLIEACPGTGRTHQIRAHLAAVGYPILGDPLYGTAQPSQTRLGLHAYRVRILHPTRAQHIQIEAPYPPDLQVIFDQVTQPDGFSPSR